MVETMKAAVVHEFGKPLVIEEVPVPEVRPGQILVKVAASGVCHTDLHAAEGDWPVKPAALHSRPRGRRPRRRRRRRREAGEGRRPRRRAVAAHRLRPLRALHHRLGNAVRRAAETGYSVNGGFAEYVLADPDYVGHLPAERGLRRDRARSCAPGSPSTRA